MENGINNLASLVDSDLFVPVLSLISTVLIIIVTIGYIIYMSGKYWDRLYENMLQLGIFDIDEPKFIEKLAKRYAKRHTRKIEKPNAFDKKQHPTINQVNISAREYIIPLSIGTILKRMLKRQNEYGNNYVLFQITNKVFGISSVVYSILGLIASQTQISSIFHMNIWLNPCLAFFSIVFVLIALYLSPTTRVGQYISSWKMIDEGINRAISKLEKYDMLNTKYDLYIEKNPHKFIVIQKIIEKEADSLAKTLSNAEWELTTDGE